ncbi:MAG: hypothetical protein ABI950_02050 [Solirubrobacteraceae bacterium]
MFYKALGFAVWNGVKFYVKRRTPGGGSSQKLVAAGVVALAIGSIIALGAKRDNS